MLCQVSTSGRDLPWCCKRTRFFEWACFIAAQLVKHLLDWRMSCWSCAPLSKTVVGLWVLCGVLAGFERVPEHVVWKELEVMDILLPKQKYFILPMFLACKETHPGRNLEGNGPARPRQGSRTSSARKTGGNDKEKCRRQATITGRVQGRHGALRNDNCDNGCLTPSRQSEHVFYLNTFLTHVRPSSEGLGACLKQGWRMQFH